MDERATEMDEQPTGCDFADPPAGLMRQPKNRVLAHMDDPDALRSAVDDLVAAGYDGDDIVVLCGAKGAEQLDASGRGHGLKGRLYRTLERLTDAHEVLLETEAHLASGGLLINVPADDEQRDLVVDILRKHDAHYIHHWGAITYTQLSA